MTDWPEVGTPTRRQLLAARELNNGARHDGLDPSPAPEELSSRRAAVEPQREEDSSPQARGLAEANRRRHEEAVARRARAAEAPSGPLAAVQALEPQPSPAPEIAEPGSPGPVVSGEQRPRGLLEVLTAGGGFRLELVELVASDGRRWQLRPA